MQSVLEMSAVDSSSQVAIEATLSDVQYNEHVPAAAADDDQTRLQPSGGGVDLLPSKAAQTDVAVSNCDMSSRNSLRQFNVNGTTTAQSSQNVSGHVRNKVIKAMGYVCPVCGERFQLRHLFTRHSRIHTERPYGCIVCRSENFVQSCALLYHARSVHKRNYIFENDVVPSSAEVSSQNIPSRILNAPHSVTISEETCRVKNSAPDSLKKTFAATSEFLPEQSDVLQQDDAVEAVRNHDILKKQHSFEAVEKDSRRDAQRSSELVAECHGTRSPEWRILSCTCERCDLEFRTLPLLRRHQQANKDYEQETLVFSCCADDSVVVSRSKPARPSFVVSSVASAAAAAPVAAAAAAADESGNKTIAKSSVRRSSDGESLAARRPRSATGVQRCMHQCNVCSRVFDTSGRLSRHLRAHGPLAFFNGSNGASGLQSSRALLLARERRQHVDGGDLHSCSMCRERFKTAGELRQHTASACCSARTITNDGCDVESQKRRRLLLKPLFKCVECGKAFASSLAWTRHRNLHDAEKSGTVNKCNTCGNAFVTRSALRRHKKFCDREKLLKCTVCSRLYFRLNCLVAHMCAKHPEVKGFACTVCDKRIDDVAALSTHMSIHSGKPSVVCAICNMSYSHLYGLLRHLRCIHKVDAIKASHRRTVGAGTISREKIRRVEQSRCRRWPFKCLECGKAFARLSFWSRHRELHLAEKSQKIGTVRTCDICGKSDMTGHGLTEHVRREHPEVKGRTCTVCGERFDEASALLAHLTIHTGGHQATVCTVCNVTYTRPYDLSRHMLNVHIGNCSIFDNGDTSEARRLQKPSHVAEGARANSVGLERVGDSNCSNANEKRKSSNVVSITDAGTGCISNRILNGIADGFRTCLEYFVQPNWMMSKESIPRLGLEKLTEFPLDSYLDHYETCLKKVITGLDYEADKLRSEVDAANQKLLTMRKQVAQLFTLIGMTNDAASDTALDGDHIDQVLEHCVKLLNLRRDGTDQP